LASASKDVQDMDLCWIYFLSQ